MIDRVANEVHQWFAYDIDYLFVELGILALYFEHNTLAKFLGKVTHKAVEAGKHLADGHHSRFHNTALQILGNARHLVHPVLKLVGDRLVHPAPAQILIQPEEPGIRDHQLSDIVQ